MFSVRGDRSRLTFPRRFAGARNPEIVLPKRGDVLYVKGLSINYSLIGKSGFCSRV
jgi:hypothetical protein